MLVQQAGFISTTTRIFSLQTLGVRLESRPRISRVPQQQQCERDKCVSLGSSVSTGSALYSPQRGQAPASVFVNGLAQLFSSKHAPPQEQPTQIAGIATDLSDKKRRAVDTSPTNVSHSHNSPINTSPTARRVIQQLQAPPTPKLHSSTRQHQMAPAPVAYNKDGQMLLPSPLCLEITCGLYCTTDRERESVCVCETER